MARTRPSLSTNDQGKPIVLVTRKPQPGAREQFIELLVELLDKRPA